MEVENNYFLESEIVSGDHSLIFIVAPFCFTEFPYICKAFIQMHFECIKLKNISIYKMKHF